MKNPFFKKARIAKAVLDETPPLIRKTLLEESTFRTNYGLKADTVLVFHHFRVSFQRSKIFNAIRKILSSKTNLTLVDTEGKTWNLSYKAEEDALPTLFISNDEEQLDFPGFTTLSPDATVRLRSLDESASDVNLPNNVKQTWHTILEKRSLHDQEANNF